jgi:CxxC-x17-CxxC domain-containing protein
MYGAICDKCGRNCKIPFEPTSGRPVFCSNCFETNGQTSPRRDNGRPERPVQTGPNYKEQFDALNAKMDLILSLLTPTAPKAAKVAAKAATVEVSDEPAVAVLTDSDEPKEVVESTGKKPKTKATLAAKKKRAKSSPKKK